MRVAVVAGIRPNFIKLAPVIHELKKSSKFQVDVIHTGQHYDYEMSRRFFLELGLPDPKVNLEVGAGSQAFQVAETMMRLEKIFESERPSFVIVAGDGNPTLGAALAASKLLIPVCHLEAGLRSFDLQMPEELNRRMTDHVSTVLFAPTEVAATNLLQEGFPEERIVRTGDTMVDVLNNSRKRIDGSKILQELRLNEGRYGVATLHRAENVDNPKRLRRIVNSLIKLEKHIVFPVHPRTRARLKTTHLENKLRKQGHISLVEPVGYFEMMRLMSKSRVVLTDSGGIQKEAFLLGVPCVTLRDSTEWIETVLLGANTLAGDDPARIVSAVKKAWNTPLGRVNTAKGATPYGKGGAAKQIVTALESLYDNGKLSIPKINFLEKGMAVPYAYIPQKLESGRLEIAISASGKRSPYLKRILKAPASDSLVVGKKWIQL